MPLHPTLPDIALRIALACLAGVLIGYNREGRNQAAGLRTTVLVCLAACLSTVLANLLLSTSGKDQGSFSQIDVMRLPLGILSGIGFLGAGAIIRRGDSVLGVTTAATLWFMTVVGLCFGAGEIELGAAGSVLAFLILWGLGRADERMPRKQRGFLTLSAERERFSEAELRRAIDGTGVAIVSWGVTYSDGGSRYEAVAELEWRGRADERSRCPKAVEELLSAPAVTRAEWKPQALSA
jgi:putative Mg2+ transporter-C (MgtC) family protein